MKFPFKGQLVGQISKYGADLGIFYWNHTKFLLKSSRSWNLPLKGATRWATFITRVQILGPFSELLQLLLKSTKMCFLTGITCWVIFIWWGRFQSLLVKHTTFSLKNCKIFPKRATSWEVFISMGQISYPSTL